MVTVADPARARAVLIGAVAGVTWGAALRAWMVIVALQFRQAPDVTWLGTFGGVLTPAAIVGALLGRAVHVATTEPDRLRRWVLGAPALLAIGPALTQTGFFTRLVTTGMGGGTIGVALIAILGGFALSGTGRTATRRGAAGLAWLLLVALIGPVFLAGPTSAFPPQPDDALSLALFLLLMVSLVSGVSAPFRLRNAAALDRPGQRRAVPDPSPRPMKRVHP